MFEPKKKKQIEIDRNYILSKDIKEFNLFTDEELIKVSHSEIIFDIECYPNYFLIAFKHVKSGKCLIFEKSPDSEIDVNKLEWTLWNFCLIGFNSNNYDLFLILMCIQGYSIEQLKNVSDRIILGDLKAKNIEQEFKIKIPYKLNHIDLIEIAPLSASLKTYAGRMHCEKMQDLPFEPNQHLTKEQALAVKYYCINDLNNTQLLFEELAEQIKLRIDMSQEFNIDLRSKSDAQIAEHVIASEIAKINGYWPKRSVILAGQSYRYTPPWFLKFITETLQKTFLSVLETDFIVGLNGSIETPTKFEELKIKIGNSTYQMGIGGLHSCEEKISHKADENTLLIDRDVASYYPSIILNNELYPKHMGRCFLEVYKCLVDKRLKAKKAKDKVTANSLKIVINGSFGKLGNKYSCLYSPDLLLQVTITGQLCLLMLIEAIENVGISVISGNTDGIIIKCPKSRYEELNTIIKNWEILTNFETEETKYKGVYSRDVNNYIAIKEDGKVKVKGVYSERGSANDSRLSKNPENLICSDAVIKFLTENIPIEETIKNCKDIRRFVTVRNVKGGAHKNGKYLGKVVRFYQAIGEKGTINYISSGNKVPNSDGAKPLMDLTPIPEDLNFEYYIREAEEMLYDIGYFKPKKQGLF